MDQRIHHLEQSLEEQEQQLRESQMQANETVSGCKWTLTLVKLDESASVYSWSNQFEAKCDCEWGVNV